MSTALPWVMLPTVGALIGYGTNYLAVRMIFRPVRPVRILGFTLQGLVPRRQAELAASVGRVVGEHLLSHDDLTAALARVDLGTLVTAAFDRGIVPEDAACRRVPHGGARR